MKKSLSPILQVISFFLPCLALLDLLLSIISCAFPTNTPAPDLSTFFLIVKYRALIGTTAITILAFWQWISAAIKYIDAWLSSTLFCLFHTLTMLGYLACRLLTPYPFSCILPWDDNISITIQINPTILIPIICMVMVIARGIPKPLHSAKASDQAPQ